MNNIGLFVLHVHIMGKYKFQGTARSFIHMETECYFWADCAETRIPPISRTIGRKYRDRKRVARWSKGPSPGFGRTLVNSTIWSHAGQKDRIIIFGGRAAKMGKKSWRETFSTIGVKVCSISWSKFWKFDPLLHLERTKHKFWLQAGQKDRIVIFGHGAAKMGKKSWRKTFGTTGVKFRNKILSPSWKIWKFDPFGCTSKNDQSQVLVVQVKKTKS